MNRLNIIDRVRNICDNFDINDVQMPKSMKIELSAICNHKCSYCVVPSLKIRNKFISKDIFQHCLLEASRLNIKEIGLFHMGEGTLHPDFYELVDLIPNTFDVFITTNGTQLPQLKYLVEKNIKSIKFSLNGYNKEIHKNVTGVDTFDLIIRNLKELVEYRNNINSSTQISASSIYYNCQEQDNFAEKICNIADKYYFTQIFNQANKVDNKFIQLTDNNLILKDNMKLPCFGLYNLCHIKANGDVNLCRFGVDDEFTIGNIMEKNLEDIWFSEKANEIRYKSSYEALDTCNKCVGICNGI